MFSPAALQSLRCVVVLPKLDPNGTIRSNMNFVGAKSCAGSQLLLALAANLCCVCISPAALRAHRHSRQFDIRLPMHF